MLILSERAFCRQLLEERALIKKNNFFTFISLRFFLLYVYIGLPRTFHSQISRFYKKFNSVQLSFWLNNSHFLLKSAYIF